MSLPTRIVRHVDPFELSQRDLDTVFSRFFGQPLVGTQTGVTASYPVDVREQGDAIVVEAELPGFNKDQIDITLEDGVLTLTAERTDPAASNGKGNSNVTDNGNYLLKERRYTRVQRSFNLPPAVDSGGVSARLDNGVLTLTLQKRQEAKPRKIAVA